MQVTAAPNPTMAVAADLKVRQIAAGVRLLRVVLEGGAGRAPRTTLTVVPEGQDRVEITVLGLKPGGQNSIQVVPLRDGEPDLPSAVTAQVLAPPLPERFPTFTVVRKTSPQTAPVALSCAMLTGSSWAVVVDTLGHPLWYRAVSTITEDGLDFQMQPNGNFTVYQDRHKGFEELGQDGRLVRHRRSLSATRGTNGHELRVLPGGEAVYLGYSGSDAAPVDILEVVDDSKRPLFYWETPPAGDPADDDPYHPNSVDVTTSGDLLLSLRSTSTVLMIERRTGRTAWRLSNRITRPGAPGSSHLRVLGDPLGGPSMQHHARMTAPNRVLLFDNGNERTNPRSRVVEYQIDTFNSTATLVWQCFHTPPIYTIAGGSAQRLPGGNTLVAWTLRARVTEVNPGCQVRWELQSSCTAVYRALSVEQLRSQ